MVTDPQTTQPHTDTDRQNRLQYTPPQLAHSVNIYVSGVPGHVVLCTGAGTWAVLKYQFSILVV